MCRVSDQPFFVVHIIFFLSLAKDLELKSARLSEMEALLSESQEKVRDLSIPPPDVPGADRQELLRLLDRRQHEITRLSDEWRTLSSKLEITAAKKSEFQTKLVIA